MPRSLPISNGKIGAFGTCSGGRHVYLAASRIGLDAVADLWGGRVVMAPPEITDKQPVAPIEYTKDLSRARCSAFRRGGSQPRRRSR